MSIDSKSVGDPQRFQTFDTLVAGLTALPTAPLDVGSVISVIIRGDGGQRQTLNRVRLSPLEGVHGDAWQRQKRRDPQEQIAVMQADVAQLIANGQPLALFGDSLFLALDLSTQNLPAGSTLRVGSALLEVTPTPHNGCRKFQARFGSDALRFVSTRELRPRNLRGVYMHVIVEGDAGPGDAVSVVERGRAS
jgi:MOSC domain-containing protein YiiM